MLRAITFLVTCLTFPQNATYIFVNLVVKTLKKFKITLAKYVQACSLPSRCGYFSYTLELNQRVLGDQGN